MIDKALIRQNFASLLEEIQLCSSGSPSALKEALTHYVMDCEEAQNLHEDVLSKYQGAKSLKRVWHDNEIRLFFWMLCHWELVTQKSPDRFAPEDWQTLAECLPRKVIGDLKFEWRMRSRNQFTDSWTTEELELLEEIIRDQKLQNKWNDVSRQLFNASAHKFFRRPKQCREQWKNHLDPDIKKGDWTQNDDCELLELVLELGKKWSSLSKCIGKRTEHAVKNRFNSLIKQYSKTLKRGGKEKTQGKRRDEEEEIIKTILKRIQETSYEDKEGSKQGSKDVSKDSRDDEKETTTNKDIPTKAPSRSLEEEDLIMFGPGIQGKEVGDEQMELQFRGGYGTLVQRCVLNSILMVNSPKILSPPLKSATRWKDLDNQQYFQ